MEGSNGFGIDSILSHRAGSPALPKGDPLLGDCRSPLELSPRSESSSDCSSPASPERDCLETGAPRPGGAQGPGLDSHLQAGQLSAPAQSRTVTSSFLIRDILADCKPLAACAPYSSSGPPAAPEPGGRLAPKAGEDFRDKLDKSGSNASSDSEYKGKKAGGGSVGGAVLLKAGSETCVHTGGDTRSRPRAPPGPEPSRLPVAMPLSNKESGGDSGERDTVRPRRDPPQCTEQTFPTSAGSALPAGLGGRSRRPSGQRLRKDRKTTRPRGLSWNALLIGVKT